MSDSERFIQIGDKVRILLSEPWNLSEALGGKRFLGVVTAIDQSTHEKVIVHLDEELVYDQKKSRYFSSSTRYSGVTLSSDLDFGMAICNFASLTDEEGKAGLPTSIDSWDKRICAIGSLSWSGANTVPEEPPINSELGRHIFHRLSGSKRKR